VTCLKTHLDFIYYKTLSCAYWQLCSLATVKKGPPRLYAHTCDMSHMRLLALLGAHIAHRTSHSSQLTSHIAHRTAHSSCLTSHVSCLTSHVSRVASHISHLLFHISYLSYLSYLISHFSFLICLMFHISYFISHLISAFPRRPAEADRARRLKRVLASVHSLTAFVPQARKVRVVGRADMLRMLL